MAHEKDLANSGKSDGAKGIAGCLKKEQEEGEEDDRQEEERGGFKKEEDGEIKQNSYQH